MNGKKILIAEDSIVQAEALRSLLRLHEYTVEIVSNGKEGLCRVRESEPSLIISGVRMPEMDGYEFCRNVKSDERFAGNPIPFVLLTAQSDAGAIIRGLECGADYFITKPYDEEQLLARIDDILRGSPRRIKPDDNTSEEIWHDGERFFINSDRQQIFEFLLPAFEAAVQRNTELSRAQEELRKLVEEATSALQGQLTDREALESQLRQSQKMESIGRLAGGIAHDFNNLLTVIQGRAQLLFEQVADEEVRAELDLIRKTGARAARLTHQLLAFSRKQAVQLKTIDLAALVADVEKMLTRVIGKDVTFVVRRGTTNLGLVKADPNQIEQVLLNLVVNSRDAMPNGGTIIVETANADLDDTHCSQPGNVKPGRYVMLAVADTGEGMDDEIKAKIFDPFFTTKEKDKGTGLGLSTVHSIVQQSGGHITLDSKRGRGATFRIYLPRIEETIESVAETVLVAEDELAVRKSMLEILHMKGYTVLEAESARDAIRISESHDGSIDLVVTDVAMAGTNGWDLVGLLRTRRPQLRALFISGYADPEIIRKGIQTCGGGFLQKPVTADSLVDKVRAVLDAEGSRTIGKTAVALNAR